MSQDNTAQPVPTITGDADGLSIRIPMKFKRRGGRRELVVPAVLGVQEPTERPAQEALAVALARAHLWLGLIESGKYLSISRLATTIGADRSYVSRIMRLTLLAPDIVEAILAGEEPSGLTLAKLVGKLPMMWEEQRKVFGFG
ncbi:MAG: hypothetical protein ACYS9X_29095 [Planctomycetota bacterium]|jgi:hypothetical protein